MTETTCIKCGKPCTHSLCVDCADTLIDSYDPISQAALAMLGLDVIKDRDAGIIRPQGYLKTRFEEYKKVLREKRN